MFELGVKLRGERFVVGNNQRRALHALDDVRHRESFSGAGYAEERLIFVPAFHAACDEVDCLRLIAHRFKFR